MVDTEKLITIEAIKDELFKSFLEYKNDPKMLQLAAEALTDLNQISYSLRDRVAKDGGGVKTIADGLTRDFFHKGYINFNGVQIKSMEDFAELQQAYRFNSIYCRVIPDFPR